MFNPPPPHGIPDSPAWIGSCAGRRRLSAWQARAGAPANGAIIRTTDPNTSGRARAQKPATHEPKSYPIGSPRGSLYSLFKT